MEDKKPSNSLNEKYFIREAEYRVNESPETDCGCENQIICGDSLKMLGYMPKCLADLIYIDPPYFTKRNYPGTTKLICNGKLEKAFIDEQFSDTWSERDYKVFIDNFIRELKNLLKASGCIAVHCNNKCKHIIKSALDKHFGKNNFICEIPWNSGSKNRNNKQTPIDTYDYILIFARDKKYFSPNIYLEPTEEELRTFSLYDAAKQDYYRLENLESWSERKNLKYCITDPNTGVYHPPFNGWRFKESEMNRFINEGHIEFPASGNGKPKLKVFRSEYRGKRISTDFSDIKPVRCKNVYPTQKPVELLMRIIKYATNKGGLVLDCFGGSGTTAIAAAATGRHYIIIDKNRAAIEMTAERLVNEANKEEYFKRADFNIYSLKGADTKESAVLSIAEAAFAGKVNNNNIINEQWVVGASADIKADISITGNTLVINDFQPNELIKKLNTKNIQITGWKQLVKSISIDCSCYTGVFNPDAWVFKAKKTDIADSIQVTGEYTINPCSRYIMIKLTDISYRPHYILINRKNAGKSAVTTTKAAQNGIVHCAALRRELIDKAIANGGVIEL